MTQETKINVQFYREGSLIMEDAFSPSEMREENFKKRILSYHQKNRFVSKNFLAHWGVRLRGRPFNFFNIYAGCNPMPPHAFSFIQFDSLMEDEEEIIPEPKKEKSTIEYVKQKLKIGMAKEEKPIAPTKPSIDGLTETRRALGLPIKE